MMKELRIAASKNTPEVYFHPGGLIRIRGRSIHENVAEFYSKAEEWIDKYIESPAETTQVDINLEYFNSASAKILVHIFQKIIYVALKDKKYVFNWYYEDGDDDIYERGEYFSSILDIPFNFIRTK